MKPEILKKNGRNEFVILTYEDYVRLREMVEDAEDLRRLRASKARQGGAKRTPLAEVKRLLRGKSGRRDTGR